MATVEDIINAVIREIPNAPFDDTVDTIKLGRPEQEANLVISHEPVFYNHRDERDWLTHSRVYQAKRELAEKHGIAIWRCHDYAHSLRPDIIEEGVIDALSWAKYRVPQSDDERRPPVFELTHRPRPSALANELKSGLVTSRVLLAGDPDTQCRRVAIMVGAPGGRRQIEAMIATDVDAIVAGETNEWEAPEYFRDAAFQKTKKALLVVGHQPSEEAGMARLASWLGEKFPGLPVMHRAAGDPLRVI